MLVKLKLLLFINYIMFIRENKTTWETIIVRSHFIYTALWLIALATCLWSFYIVNPWEVAVIKTFGNLNNNIKQSWLYWKKPFIDNVIKFNVQTNKDSTVAAAASKDLQNITTEIVVNYSINANSVVSIYTDLWSIDWVKNKIISPSIQEVVKAVTSKYTAEELVTKRSSVSSDMTEWLKTKIGKLWITVSDVNIVNFKFSDWFDQAIEEKVKAEQDALASKNKLEQVKYEAEQQIVKAKAEAETIRIQAQAITSQWWKEYVQMKWISKWNGVLPTHTLWNNTTMMMNL